MYKIAETTIDLIGNETADGINRTASQNSASKLAKTNEIFLKTPKEKFILTEETTTKY